MLILNWRTVIAAGVWALGAGLAATGFLGFAGLGPLAVDLASLPAATAPLIGLAAAAACGRAARRLAPQFRQRSRWRAIKPERNRT
jgi:hypothetical protein